MLYKPNANNKHTIATKDTCQRNNLTGTAGTMTFLRSTPKTCHKI